MRCRVKCLKWWEERTQYLQTKYNLNQLLQIWEKIVVKRFESLTGVKTDYTSHKNCLFYIRFATKQLIPRDVNRIFVDSSIDLKFIWRQIQEVRTTSLNPSIGSTICIISITTGLITPRKLIKCQTLTVINKFSLLFIHFNISFVFTFSINRQKSNEQGNRNH